MSAIGTRTHKVGSIYSRVKNMLSSGAMKSKDKPLWYDIYEAFPPKREPVYIPGPVPDKFGLVVSEDNVRPLFYKEDWARASMTKLYKDFSSVYNLLEDSKPTKAQTFTQVYISMLTRHPELSKEEIFQLTEEALHHGFE